MSKWVWPRCGVSGGKRDPCDRSGGSLVHPHARFPSSALKIEKLVPYRSLAFYLLKSDSVKSKAEDCPLQNARLPRIWPWFGDSRIATIHLIVPKIRQRFANIFAYPHDTLEIYICCAIFSDMTSDTSWHAVAYKHPDIMQAAFLWCTVNHCRKVHN